MILHKIEVTFFMAYDPQIQFTIGPSIGETSLEGKTGYINENLMAEIKRLSSMIKHQLETKQ